MIPDTATERVRNAAREYEKAKMVLENFAARNVPSNTDARLQLAEERALASAERARAWRRLGEATAEYARQERG
ncbi:MAG: hypothetical protein AAGJ94_12585 [Pseudomonadota bacterium]